MRAASTIHCRLFLTGLLLFGLTASAAAQRSDGREEVLERRFPVRPGETLHLRSDLGSVQVRGTSGSEVKVRVTKRARGAGRGEVQALFDRFDVHFAQTRGGLEVEGAYDRPVRAQRNSLQVAYEIEVPHAFNVDLQTAGGSISIERIQGDAKVRTSGGSIRLQEVAGLVMAHTSGGSITAERIGADASLRTSGGSITARQVDGSVEAHTDGGSITSESIRGDVEARTSGGSITARDIYGSVNAQTEGGSIHAALAGQPRRPMTLRTAGGSVRLALDPGVRAEIDAEAQGGRVSSELPVSGQLQRGRLRGALNGGGPLLTLRSAGGSVSIQRH